MPECPCCLGEGALDLRDLDAVLAEHLDNPPSPVGVVACAECEATGIVSHDRYLDLMASALAAVDQVVARVFGGD